MIMMYIGCVHCPAVYFVYCVLCVLPCPAPPSIHYKANTGGVSPHMNTKAPNLKCFCCAHVSGAPWYTIVDTCRIMVIKLFSLVWRNNYVVMYCQQWWIVSCVSLQLCDFEVCSMLNQSSVQCVGLSPQSQELVITHKYLTNPCWTILAMQCLDVRPLNTCNAMQHLNTRPWTIWMTQSRVN